MDISVTRCGKSGEIHRSAGNVVTVTSCAIRLCDRGNFSLTLNP